MPKVFTKLTLWKIGMFLIAKYLKKERSVK